MISPSLSQPKENMTYTTVTFNPLNNNMFVAKVHSDIVLKRDNCLIQYELL